DLADLVVHQLAEGLERRVHAAPLLAQALVEGLRQTHVGELLEETLRQHQRRARREVARAIAALAARRRVDLDDLSQLITSARLVVRRLVHPCDLEARLDDALDRLRELTHVVEIRGERAAGILGLLLEPAPRE